ncbi:hypothetical protein FJ366_02760 [Candidatus Dependentiae bacterium]|nr:hypothetical protein [Candidatus Dependentiae bacterium]
MNEIYLGSGYLYTIKKADGTCIPALGYRNGTLTEATFDQNLGYVLISSDGTNNMMWGLYHDGATWKTALSENIEKYE